MKTKQPKGLPIWAGSEYFQPQTAKMGKYNEHIITIFKTVVTTLKIAHITKLDTPYVVIKKLPAEDRYWIKFTTLDDLTKECYAAVILDKMHFRDIQELNELEAKCVSLCI